MNRKGAKTQRHFSKSMPHRPFLRVFATLRFIAVLTALSASASAADEEMPVDYVRQIKPLFAKHCVRCHGAEQQKSDLRVDSGKSLLAGGKLGPAVVAGKAAKSPLVEAILGTSNTIVAMPPTGEGDPLSAEAAALVKRWIDEGAKFPEGK
jgi:mono/diheme cytochrome c family protein